MTRTCHSVLCHDLGGAVAWFGEESSCEVEEPVEEEEDSDGGMYLFWCIVFRATRYSTETKGPARLDSAETSLCM
jgi:hypothetical protein